MENNLLIVKNQCERWINDSKEMALFFEDKNMISSAISSTAMAQAYQNVVDFIEENLL